MNRNIILILLILCYPACKAQTDSKVIALVYELNEKGEIEGKADTLATEYLDKEGNIFKKISTRRFEDIIFVTTTLYNSNGKSIE